MNRRRWIPVVLIMVIALLLFGCSPQVVATVNGTKITQDQLEERVTAAKKVLEQQGADFSGKEGEALLELVRRQTLDQLIDQELLWQEATRLGLKPTSAQVQEQIQHLRRQFDSEGKYKQFLAANGFSEPKLQDLLEKDMAIKALQENVLADVKLVTVEQAREYYSQHREQYTRPQQWQVRHILITVPQGEDSQRAQVEAKAQALSILNQLKQGGDFAALVKEKSQDPGTKESGGLYTFSPGEAVAEFEQAVKSLKVGEITAEPVKTRYGYHIIKLEKIIPATVQPFDQVKEELIASLTDQARQQEFDKYLQGLRDKARIENKLLSDKTSTKQ